MEVQDTSDDSSSRDDPSRSPQWRSGAPKRDYSRAFLNQSQPLTSSFDHGRRTFIGPESCSICSGCTVDQPPQSQPQSLWSCDPNKLEVIFKNLDTLISNMKINSLDKVSALMSAGSVLMHYATQMSPEQTLSLFQLFYRHTLTLVFHGDWGKNSAATNLVSLFFQRFKKVAEKNNLPSVVTDCKSLLCVLCDPWGNPTMKKILEGDYWTEEEVSSLIEAEMGMMLKVRLEIMVEARCDVQAMRLVEACLQWLNSKCDIQAFREDIIYIKDVYLILLVRQKENNKVLSEVNKMGLEEVLELVRRCAKADPTAHFQKSRINMIEKVVNTALVSAMIQPVTDEKAFYDLIEVWVGLFSDNHALLHEVLTDVILTAVSSQHIYIFLQLLLDKKFGDIEKTVYIAMSIRALTINMNELEKHKSNCEDDKVKEYELHLANGYLQLGEYLKSDIVTCRECILTAFSLDPNKKCYEIIKDLAIKSGKLIQVDQNLKNNRSSINCEEPKNQCPEVFLGFGKMFENNNLYHQQVTFKPDSFVKGVEPITALSPNGKKGTLSKYEVVLSPIQISDAQKLGVSQTLHDDLYTVISSARYLVLNWDLDWEELSSRCESYIASGKEARRTKKELRFLNIDYNIFNM